MKRLSVLVCIFVATLTFFGTTSLETSAQTASVETISTDQKTVDALLVNIGITPMNRSQLLTKGNGLFDVMISDETALRTRTVQPTDSDWVKARKAALSNFSQTAFDNYLTKNDLLIKTLQGAKSTFSNFLTTPPAPSTNVYGDYKAAFQAAIDFISRESAKNGIVANSPAKTDSNEFTARIRQEKDRIPDTLNTLGPTGSGATTNAAAADQTRARAEQESAENKTCDSFFSFSVSSCVNDFLTWIIKGTLMQIGGFFVWLTANLFNKSVQIGILHFQAWAPVTLYPIWVIVRQIVSLIIVFVGLYLGFMYIIGREDRFQKYIPWVIIFGLFVNFSYPFARTLIDISNIVSLNVYTAAVGPGALQDKPAWNKTAGGMIMQSIGLQELAMSATSLASDKDKNVNILKEVKSVPGALVAVAYIFYAAYVFFMATALMVMRTLSLVFISIISPLLLVDSVLPLLGNTAKQLRKIFVDQLVVGPLFMIMLALTMKFLEVFSRNAGTGVGAAGLGTGTTDASVATFFNILLMLIMLHLTLKVTKSMSGSIGQYATDAMGKVGGFGLGVASGGSGLLARNVIGRAAARVRDSDSKWVDPNTFAGRKIYEFTNSIAKSSFDLRNSSVVAKGAGMAGLSGGLMGVGMGSGTKTDFDEEAKKRAERIKFHEGRIKTRYERDVYKKDAKGKVMLDDKGMPIVEHKKDDLIKAGVEAKERYQANYGGSMFLTSKQKAEMDDKAAEERSKNLMEEYKKLPKNQRARKITELRAALERQMQTDKKMETTESRALAKTLQDLRNDKSEVDENVQSVFDEYKDKNRDDKKMQLDEIAAEVNKNQNNAEWLDSAEGQKLSRLKKMMEAEQKEFKKKVEEATSTYQTLKDEKAKNEFLAKNLTKEVREQVMKDLHLTPTGDLLDKSGISAQMAKGMEEVAKRASSEQNNAPSMSSQMAQGMEAAGRRMAEQQAQATQTAERSSPSFSMTSGPGVSFVDHLKKTRHITQQPEPATPDQNTPQVTTSVGGAYSAQGTVTPTKINFSSQISSEQQARITNSVQTAGVRAEPHTAAEAVAPSATTKPAANKDSVNTTEDESTAAMA